LLENEHFKADQQTVSEYLFVHFEETLDDIIDLASTFIHEGDNVEIYPFADKLGKQFAYADKK
jgi:histidyl-tRNA synthetase